MAGRIWQLTQRFEQRRGAFAVARLIMLSGVKVRAYRADSEDDPEDLKRVVEALSSIESGSVLDELLQDLELT